jgi:hypothetical protein
MRATYLYHGAPVPAGYRAMHERTALKVLVRP